MANWIKKINIQTEMEATRSGNSNVKELVASIISKLKTIKYSKNDSESFEELNEDLESLIFEFQDFHDSSDCENVEEFDCLLGYLYDFGDSAIGNFESFSNCKKALWIES